jgi:hypothetical protein
MSGEFRCGSCGSLFSNRSNLTRHLKTLKKHCSAEKKSYQCSYCEYITSTTRGVKIHEYRCKSRERAQFEKEIKELKMELEKAKQEIIDLKLQLAEKKGMLSIKAAPKNVTATATTTTNYVNQKLMSIACSTIDPLTVDTVKKSVGAGNYTFQHFKLGPQGIVDFISDIICTEDGQRNYACSDISRNKCHRLIETREWQTDNGATFINKILDELKEQAISYTQKVADMWKKPEERDYGDELRERTREMVSGIIHPKSTERKDLFTKVRAGVKTLAAV